MNKTILTAPADDITSDCGHHIWGEWKDYDHEWKVSFCTKCGVMQAKPKAILADNEEDIS